MSNKSRLRNIFLTLSSVALVAGCATTSIPEESGFLPDYSRLQQESIPGGGARLVYVNPAFTPDRYTAVKLDPVVYYPKPQPTDGVSNETLTQVRKALDQSLRKKLGQKIRLVDQAGPGVAHVRLAITAVGSETRSLKAYQFIPVALAVTGAKAVAQGGLPNDATIAIESQVTDSKSGELLYASVRGGTGERVVSASQGKGGVQLSSLQPLIDAWTTAAANQVQKYIKAK
ncbi:DUF3313 domain-containing protein [Pollutimonas harenae]|uniref:DUF3313 domain-containing protein n=1 Tax=Pollutimonas harenae TaxID=657015 RepID=A0A853H5L1_9BURK|nr:DUF3313 domain-containing protein [Pollutimonas harenae]NYT85394.1 DUF3313 domain-containing protein [Pollutimonas harenae]TEA70491.1 DUF3313 domain-containing protein [Pollutimonas harenae]